MSLEQQGGAEKLPRSVELIRSYIENINRRTHFVDIYTDTLDFMGEQFNYDSQSAQEIISGHQLTGLYPTPDDFEFSQLTAKDKLLSQLAVFMIPQYDMQCQMEFMFSGKPVEDETYAEWIKAAYVAVADLGDMRHSLQACKPHTGDEVIYDVDGICPLRSLTQSVFSAMHGFSYGEPEFRNLADMGVDIGAYLRSESDRIAARYTMLQSCNIIPPSYIDDRYDDYVYSEAMARKSLYNVQLSGKYRHDASELSSTDDDDQRMI